MSCIDHLLRFPDEPSAQADSVVGKYWSAPSDDSPGGWRGDVCIPGVRVYLANPDGSTTDVSGWHMIIALSALDPALQNLASNGCRLIADRDAANRGDPNFIRYTAPDLTQATLAAAHVEPTFAGSNYPFGNG